MKDNTTLLQSLEKVEKLSKGSIFDRLTNNPSNYIKAQLYSKIIRKFTHKGTFAIANTFYGTALHIALPASSDIYITGGKTHDSEIRLSKFIIKNLNETDTFIDVGTHFGFFTCLASQILSKGKVFSFEASAETYKILKKNTENLKNVSTFHQAISNSIGELEFYEFPVLYSEYNSSEIEQYKHTAWYKNNKPNKNVVKTTSLDIFIEENHLLPTIIKIDVEGAEHLVLEGLKNTLNSQNTHVVMEYLSDERDNKNHTIAENIFKQYQYLPHIIQNDGSLLLCTDVVGYMKNHQIDSENIVFKKT
jgi:FkbM family methyltransferase